MSRFDGEITAAGDASLDLIELLTAFAKGPGAAAQARGRQDAMAQYLSGAEGWRDAAAALRGTFAHPSRLTRDQEE